MAQFGTADETGEPDRVPQTVVEWIVQLPPGSWRGSLSPAIKEWNSADPRQLIDWISQLPANLRSAVAAEYAQPILEEQQAEAAEILVALPDKQLPHELYVGMLKRFRDEGAYTTPEIEQLPLVEAEKERIADEVGPDKEPPAEK